MQAIILAAGMGRRLGEFTKDNTKCMVEVNGTRLIDRFIRQLSRYNLDRIIIVTGYKGENLKEYIRNKYEDTINIEFIDNPVYDKTNNIYSLALAKDEMCKDDTILLESDLVFEDKILDLLVKAEDKDLSVVAKYESWMDGTMVCIDDDRKIINFVPKSAFRFEDADEYYKTVNVYKFSKEFSQSQYVPFLEAYCKVMGNNEYYEQVLSVLTHLSCSTLKALPITNEKWYEIDDAQDLDIATALFAEGKDKFEKYHKRYGGFWRFPQLLDYCYLVNPYFPTRKMREEIKSNFDTLLENYPSGMYVNSLLAGKYFKIHTDNIVVGNGAAELIKNVMEKHSGKKTGVIFPTFDEYPNRLKEDQIIPFVCKTKDFSYTADDLIGFFKDKNLSMLILINPDNPSGHFMKRNETERIAAWCEDNGITLLLDESFSDFTSCPEEDSLLKQDILEKYPSMLIMKSISKSYGVPGLRLGVLAGADKNLIASIKKEVSIWNINSFAEFYMQIFGKYESDYHRASESFKKERERFFKKLGEITFLRVIPSQANYFLCEVTDRFTSAELAEKLLEKDIIISNCGKKKNMQGRNLIRLAIRNSEDNDQLISELHNLE